MKKAVDRFKELLPIENRVGNPTINDNNVVYEKDGVKFTFGLSLSGKLNGWKVTGALHESFHEGWLEDSSSPIMVECRNAVIEVVNIVESER